MPAIPAIAVVLAILTPAGAFAATFREGVDARGRAFVRMEGEMAAGDAAALSRALAGRHGSAAPYLVLSSPGGDGWEGVRVALMIRAAGIAVTVPADARCASSCFSVLAGARERFASSGSRVAVHRASARGDADAVAVETARADHATLDLVGLYASWDVRMDILGGMASTSHAAAYLLDGRQLAATARLTADGLPPSGWVGHASTARVPGDGEVEASMAALRAGGGGWRPAPAGDAAVPVEVRALPLAAVVRIGIDTAVAVAAMALVLLLRGVVRRTSRARPRPPARPMALPAGVVDLASRR